MNDLGHYRGPSPLSGGARLLRGFRRIGLVLSVLVAIIGVVVTIAIALEQRQSIHGRYRQALCIRQQLADRSVVMYEYDKYKIDLSRSGCPGPLYAEIAPVIASYANPPPEFLAGMEEPISIGLPITAALAAVTFLFFWLIGWICAGFTRD